MIVPSSSTSGKSARKRKATRHALAIAAFSVAGFPLAAEAAVIDKWWEGKLGMFASQSWATSKRAPQALTFLTCSHNWAPEWGRRKNVRIELVEEKDFLPDPVHASMTYACNNNDALLESGQTNKTNYHFDFEPGVDARTSGTMNVLHSK